MIRYLSLTLMLVLFASSALAQLDPSTRVTYTEEFAGASIQSGNIGALGWNFEGNATPGQLFNKTPNVLNTGHFSIFTSPPLTTGALVLGTLEIGNPNAAIPQGIQNATWFAQFTFAISAGFQQTYVGFFIPAGLPSLPILDGCYLRFDGSQESTFQYVCRYPGGAQIAVVDSGVPVEAGPYYTLRMRGQLGGTMQFSLTKLTGGSTAEDESTRRSVPTVNVFRDFGMNPAFQTLGDENVLIADYFHFTLEKVRR